jgi:hypothetical protein
MEDIKEKIYDFVSSHEFKLSRELKEKNEDRKVIFTRNGNSVACRAIYDIIEMLDDDTKNKVFEMMQNKMYNYE